MTVSRNGAPIPSHPTDDMPIVRLVNLHKSFGALRVLDGVSLALHAGQNTVILGPSGAGKSVLLKHIVGLLRPDEGEVYFRNVRVDNVPERRLTDVRRNIGFLFQMSALFDSMTVEENVAFPLAEHTDLSKQDRRDRVAEALRTVEMEGSQHKLPAQLSGGQRKRVGLARAVILRPALVLYDEPTTGLDPIRADGINELILKMRDVLGLTGIVVTHDLASARKVGDRVLVLYEGKIIADGTFDEVEQSAHPYVRRFLSGTYHPERQAPTPTAQAITQEPT